MLTGRTCGVFVFSEKNDAVGVRPSRVGQAADPRFSGVRPGICSQQPTGALPWIELRSRHELSQPFSPSSLALFLLSVLATNAQELGVDSSSKAGAEETVYKNCTLLIDRDARIDQKNANTNYGDRTFNHIGGEGTDGGQDARRILLAADLGDDCTETGAPLPAGVTVVEAYLRLFTNNGPNNEPTHVVSRILDSWAEDTLTWNNQPMVAAAGDSVLVSFRNRWLVEWNVTTDVQLFQAGTPNHGWRIALANESYNGHPRRGEYLAREYIAHVDSALGRPRLQIRYQTTVPQGSINDTAVLLPNPTLDRFTVSNQCEAGVDVYQMPYGRNKLLVGKDLADEISLRDISDSLLFLDHADERFQQIFGYAYTQDVPAREPEVRICNEINNAGTDNKGIGMPASMYIGGSQGDGQKALASFLFTLAHERIHTWQHRRGSLFMQADDAGHAQLVGVEPIFYELAQQGFINEKSMPPELRSFAIYHAAMDRYLADPARTWDTFFSPAGLAAFENGTAPITDDADRQLIYSGVFEWIRQVHGVAGLAAFHLEIELMRLANGWTDLGDLPDRTADERNDFFLEALINALGVDAADYFEHWKMPVPFALADYSDGFPDAPGTLDVDGDTFTPLEGDFNDDDGTMYPGAPELIDGKDNNFDGQVDENVLIDNAGSDLSATPADNPVTLPLTLFGEIDTLADADGLQFSLPSRSLVTVVLRAVDSDTTVVANSGKEVFTFVGQVEINGTFTGKPSIEQLQHVALSRVLGAGTHTITVSAAPWGTVPANPGEYVLQVFINTFNSPGMTGLAGAADFEYRLPNGLVTDPFFSCANARDVSQAECQVLADAYTQLGGADWLDARGWRASDNVCSWKGVRCDAAGIDRLLLDEGEGRAPVGVLDSLDWSALSTSLSVLKLDGTQVIGALPAEFALLNLETFLFDPAGQLCVPNELRAWFDAVPVKSGDLLECCADSADLSCVLFVDGFESGETSAWSGAVP